MNAFKDDIVNFAPFPEGGYPQPLIKGLGQIEAGMNNTGPCRPLRRLFAAAKSGWAGLPRLSH